MDSKQVKKPYVAPRLEEHGAVQKLTLGGSIGKFLDADFPDGTPFGELTFS